MLVAAYEEEFARPLPLKEFFREPTVANMIKLANQGSHTIEQSATDSMMNAATMVSLVHSVGAYTGVWKGNRLFADSMVVGHNVRGKKAPLFWVFQGDFELLALADELGAKQPLYGMRSCGGILPIKDYDENNLQSLLDRYLWEILAIVGQRDFYLGGNCQGGIIALLLAKRLSTVKHCPKRIFLHEWSFDYGYFGGAVEIIYGEKSYTADRYTPDAMKKYDQTTNFPNLRVTSVPGGHGQFFEDEQVPFLGQVLRNSMNDGWINRIMKKCGIDSLDG